MFIFIHRPTKKLIATNFKVMTTFFRKNRNFYVFKKFDTEHTYTDSIVVDIFLTRNPYERLLSFYSSHIFEYIGLPLIDYRLIQQINKCYNVNYLNTDLPIDKHTEHFYSKYRHKNYKINSTFINNSLHRKYLRKLITPESFIQNINELAIDHNHSFPFTDEDLITQSYFYPNIKPKQTLQIENSIDELQDLFPDVCWQKKYHASHKKFNISDFNPSIFSNFEKLYEKDFQLFNYKKLN